MADLIPLRRVKLDDDEPAELSVLYDIIRSSRPYEVINLTWGDRIVGMIIPLPESQVRLAEG